MQDSSNTQEIIGAELLPAAYFFVEQINHLNLLHHLRLRPSAFVFV
jgi:hypothetical protein